MLAAFAAVALALAGDWTFGVDGVLVSQRTRGDRRAARAGRDRAEVFRVILGRGIGLRGRSAPWAGVGAALWLTESDGKLLYS
jgi:hypothetical protein